MQTTDSHPWRDAPLEALVVACSDGRFREEARAFVTGVLGLHRWDALYVPGGGGALSPSGIEFSRAHRHLEEARFLIRAHGLPDVILLFHGPAAGGPDEASCRDYRRKFPTESAHALRQRQETDAAELVRAGLGPGVRVRAYRCEVTGEGGLQFVRLGADEREVIPLDVDRPGNRSDSSGVDAPFPDEQEPEEMTDHMAHDDGRMTATLGGGCFWCLEAVFLRLAGVDRVVSGYAGGTVPNPSYELVCTGTTGHAEVVQVSFDPEALSYRELLEVLFSMHDPTTLNRQGPDIGTQYRSIILTHSEEQQTTAEALIVELDAAEVWRHPVVTEVTALNAFYPAEAHHQDYYRRNATQPYCQVMIDPKVAKLRERWATKLKPSER